ncbi:MAG: hypothetical protein ACJ746_18755, partial [Bryobacteraceae bacterium]
MLWFRFEVEDLILLGILWAAAQLMSNFIHRTIFGVPAEVVVPWIVVILTYIGIRLFKYNRPRHICGICSITFACRRSGAPASGILSNPDHTSARTYNPMPQTTKQVENAANNPAFCSLIPLLELVDNYEVLRHGPLSALYRVSPLNSYFQNDEERNETSEASMRRPLLSTENCLSPKKRGFTRGACPSCGGAGVFFPAWGEPTQPSVPWGIGKGELRSCSYKFVRPPPIRP